VDLAGLAEGDLRKALKSLGVSTGQYAGASTLIVNGMNPEPDTGIAESCSASTRKPRSWPGGDRRLVEPEKVLLAVPEGSFLHPGGVPQ
jgi:hypothetical protein